MAYKVVRSALSDHDLELIFDHLFNSYVALGDVVSDAIERAGLRIQKIEDDMEALASAPFQGTLRPDLMPGLRNVTKDKAIFYFLVDEDAELIRVLAVFFGGQDHQRHMLLRLGEHRER